jgi:hypothetical protein
MLGGGPCGASQAEAAFQYHRCVPERSDDLASCRRSADHTHASVFAPVRRVPMSRQSSRLAVGCGVAVAMAAVLWASFSSPFPLSEYCTRRHPTWVLGLFETPRYTAVTGASFLGTLLALAGLYGAGLWAVRGLGRRAAMLALLVGAPVLFALVLVPGFPLLSNDIFKYVFDGRILAIYHENPFVRVPADYPDDRFYDLVYWKAVVNAHGPLWRLLEAASAQAGGESCTRSILAMKVWPTLAYGGTIAALFLLLRQLMPDRAISGTVVYAWNPLVLLEALQNGHNDVVAALPTLLAVWAGRAGRWRLAFVLLAVGLLVKPLAAVIGPVLLLAAWKSDRAALREAFIGVGLAGAVVIVAYVPFFGGAATLQGLERGDLFSASSAELLMNGLILVGWPLDRAMAVSRLATSGAFLVLACGVLLRLGRGALSLATASAAVVFSYLLVGAQWFNPWYLLWLIPLAIVPGQPRLLLAAMSFSVLALLTYLLQYQAALVVPLVFLPTIVLITVLLVRARPTRRLVASGPPSLAPQGSVRHG